MPKSKRTRRSGKNTRQRNLPQMTTAIPRGPEGLLDGKTFVFKQYVPIVFPSPGVLGESVTIWMNASMNGYDY